MTIYGSILQGSGTQVSQSHGSTSHGGNTNWQDIATFSNFNAGTYIAFMSFSPSTDSGNYPNTDPDAYDIQIVRNSSGLTTENHNSENSPNACQNSMSILGTFTSDGTDDIVFQARTTDADAGGYCARYYVSVFAIMRQS